MRSLGLLLLPVLAVSACGVDDPTSGLPLEGNEPAPDVMEPEDRIDPPDVASPDAEAVFDAGLPEDVPAERDTGAVMDAPRGDAAMDASRADAPSRVDTTPRDDIPPRVDTAPRPDVADVPTARDTGTVPAPVPSTVRPGAECHALLRDLGVVFTVGPAARGIEDPVTATTPIAGVHYRYASFTAAERPLLMDCRLAVALVRLGRELRSQWDIDTVQHIGIYNYRTIAGSTRLSQHAYAMAIDIGGFRSTSGRTYSVLTDFVANGTPTCPPRASNAVDRTLKEIACWMYSARTFNIVLTPNYNSDHRNHYHVDLTTGSHFIGLERPEGIDPPRDGITDFLIDDE